MLLKRDSNKRDSKKRLYESWEFFQNSFFLQNTSGGCLCKLELGHCYAEWGKIPKKLFQAYRSFQSNRTQVFCKKSGVENSHKIYRKTCETESFFNNNIAGLETWNLFKKWLRDWCFPVKLAKFFRITFFQRYL